MANTILGKLGNSQFRSCLLLICCFAVALSGNTQVTLLFENFDGVTEPDLPAGWSTTFVEGVGFRTQVTNNSDFVGASGANNVVIRNSDPEGAYTLYSPVMNTLGKAQVNIQWGSRVSTNFLASGSLTPLFEYSIDGGSAWIALEYTENSGNSIWSLVNEGVAIVNEDFDNQPVLQFRWTVNIVNAPDGTYRMDDVFVSGMQMGCMDDTACNYNPDAQWDDGSCTYPGCNNSVACNYNADAGCDDGSCTLPDGCTDSLACNYANDALCDDGSCVYPDGCTDSLACNYDSLAVCPNNNCSYPGCINPSACNYNGAAGCDDGTCVLPDGCTDSLACNFSVSAFCDDASCEFPGCIDSAACNYDASAGCDDSSCVYAETNYDCEGNCLNDTDFDGICDLFDLTGCMDSSACNYNTFALSADSSCVFPGCNDSLACNFDVAAGCDDGSCILQGCTDSTACNFSDSAGCDDGSCLFTGAPCDDQNTNTFNDTLGVSCNCEGILIVLGCTDPLACNYLELANTADNSCQYTGHVCDDGDTTTTGDTLSVDCICEGYALAAGCTDSTACNFNPLAIINDNLCTYPGCMDSSACNYDEQAECASLTCEYPLEFYNCAGNCINDINSNEVCDELETGCTDSTACNFDPAAQLNDSSCSYPGCTDSLALNYNPDAACGADSLCEYLSSVHEAQWRPLLYPVPASEVLHVQLSRAVGGCEFNILDVTGRVVLNDRVRDTKMTIDITALSNGLYHFEFLENRVIHSVQSFIKVQ